MKDYHQVVDGRVYDSLMWVAQNARAAIMKGCTCNETLRVALKSLDEAFKKAELPD